MKIRINIWVGVVLLAANGLVCADEQQEIGKKIYDRAFGRGCGTCHDQAANPQLTANIKAGSLTRAGFDEVVKNGRGGMPKAIDEIMKIGAVKSAGYGEVQALDALFAYISKK